MRRLRPRTRVLITGSRDWSDTSTIRQALAAVWHPDTVLVTGAARGADTLCTQCWRHWGGRVEYHPADWQRHGKRAGYLRNHHMISLGADICLAFIRAHSRGATHCAGWAQLASIPTRTYYAD